jgi:putative (di)nucleoside polyphosphate hydrolase
MLDNDGYRLNVGLVIVNGQKEIFWAKRVGKKIWQFPQGGLLPEETAEEAMFRELREETGLLYDDVKILTASRYWHRYRYPQPFHRKVCVGQKQKWFLLEFKGDEERIDFDTTSKPEFDSWKWVHYWYPLDHIIYFKYPVYKKVLHEFAGLVLEEIK